MRTARALLSKATAVALSAALLLTAPGLDFYRAAAQPVADAGGADAWSAPLGRILGDPAALSGFQDPAARAIVGRLQDPSLDPASRSQAVALLLRKLSSNPLPAEASRQQALISSALGSVAEESARDARELSSAVDAGALSEAGKARARDRLSEINAVAAVYLGSDDAALARGALETLRQQSVRSMVDQARSWTRSAPPAAPMDAGAAVPVAARSAGRPSREVPPAPPTTAPSSAAPSDGAAALGLSVRQVNELARAQVDFERALMAAEPQLKQAIFSQRTQQRFSKAVLDLTPRLRAQGSPYPLAEALLFAAQTYYGDVVAKDFIRAPAQAGFFEKLPEGIAKLLPERIAKALPGGASPNEASGRYREMLSRSFGRFLPPRAFAAAAERPVEDRLLGLEAPRDPTRRLIARALLSGAPSLFREPPYSDGAFMAGLRDEARAFNAELDVLYAHPFTDDRQLFGSPVVESGRVLFGLGELTRQIQAARAERDAAAAQGRAPRRFLFLIKNVEALEPGVRTALQGILDEGRLSHPELGELELPANLQLLFTTREGANLEDDSFYDRVAVKTLSPGVARPMQGLEWPRGLAERNYRDAIHVTRGDGRPVLVLPGARIPLSREFAGINDKNLEDLIYEKTGLVLTWQTARMLAMMQQVKDRGGVLVRLEGPTGLGKTFTAQGFARLTGRPFYANPVNSDTELSEWIGGFEPDETGAYRFNGETPLKRRLEQGGVVALSELNTLLDSDDKASLGWWLEQIAEAEPDAQGFRVIRLSEVPEPPGRAVPVLKIHPDALIVVDTNPEGDYAARGRLPDVLKENTPALALASVDEAGLLLSADTFLKHDFALNGRVLGRGIIADGEREVLARDLVKAYSLADEELRRRPDPGQRILSMRELKRMAQDVLAALAAGMAPKQAVRAAAQTHLAAWLDDAPTLGEMTQKLDGAFGKAEAPELEDLLRDQLLVKGRPVHLRVPAGARARDWLERLGASDPSVEFSLVHATEETDRFQMEGGLVPTESGQTLEFGPGIFARMIEKAKAAPDKKIVYVFDNAHNLKPEAVVALNEFLQEGRLYPKGAGRAYELPGNAFVLFVSREDSPLAWSAAERSRFVELAAGENPAWLERAVSEESLFEGLPAPVVEALERWAPRLYEAWRASPGAPAGLLSQSLFLRFLKEAAERARVTLDAGLGAEELIARLEAAARERLYAWAAEKSRPSLPVAPTRLLRRLIQAMGSSYPNGVPAAAAPSWPRALARAQKVYEGAGDARGRREALRALFRLLRARGGEMPWQARASAQLQPLDVIRTFLPREVPEYALRSASAVAMSPGDRKLAVAAVVPGGYEVHEFLWDEKRAGYVSAGDALKHSEYIPSMAYGPLGLMIARDRGAGVSRWDAARKRFVGVEIALPDGFSGDSTELSSDGRTLAVVGKGGKILPLRWDDATARFEETPVLEVGPYSTLLVVKDALLTAFEGKVLVWRWDPVKARYLRSGPAFPIAEGLGTLAAGPGAFLIAAQGKDENIRLWRWDQAKAGYVPGPVIEDSLSRGLWLPDENTLVAGGQLYHKPLTVYNLKTLLVQTAAEPLAQALPEGFNASSAKLSPDRRIITVPGKGEALVLRWDETRERYVQTPILKLDTESRPEIAVLREVLVTAVDGKTLVWRWSAAKARYVLEGTYKIKGAPSRVAFGSDANWIGVWVSHGGSDTSIQLLKWEPAKARYALGGAVSSQFAGHLGFDNEDSVASVHKTLAVQDGRTLLIQDIPTAVSEDGRTLALKDLPIVEVVEEPAARPAAWPQALAQAQNAAESAPDPAARGRALQELGRLVADHGQDISWADRAPWQLRPSDFGQAFLPRKGVENGWYPRALAQTMDANRVAAADDDKIRFWDWDAAQLTYREAGSLECAGAVFITYAPDGRTLVTAQKDGFLRGWVRDASGRYVEKWSRRLGDFLEPQASTPDGRALLLRFYGKKAVLLRWDDAAGRYGDEEILGTYEYIRSSGISPDGRTVMLSADGTGELVFRQDDAGRMALVGTGDVGHQIAERMAVTNDGRLITVDWGKKSTHFSRWDDSQGRFVEFSPPIEPRSQASHPVAVTGDGRLLLRVSDSAPEAPKRMGGVSIVGDAVYSNEVQVLRWSAEQSRYVPCGQFGMPAVGIDSLELTPDGRSVLVRGAGARVFSLETFLVRDSGEAVLEDGRSVPVSELGSRAGVLEELAPAPAEAAVSSFTPRYGQKPFYFEADASGNVWLDFNGLRLRTRHALLRPLAEIRQRAPSAGDAIPLELSDLRDPYSQSPRPLSQDDFLVETPTLRRLEETALRDWSRGVAVNLVGSAGAGKTSIAREVALLLGLPRFVFQMHGERELSDLLGAFRQAPDGRLTLTAKPWRDAQGRLRFNLPLLDLLANGGIFVADEGAIGDRGRELLSWFSGLAQGDRRLVLQEFPGHERVLEVNPDFGLIITNNRPEDTAGRLQPKSEIAANVDTLDAPDDDEAPTLERVFARFLGRDVPASPQDIERWGKAVARLHHLLKPEIGKTLGQGNKDRYYLSKREVRRAALQTRHALEENPKAGDDALYGALRTTYEAMFSRPEERRLVREKIAECLGADAAREARFDQALRAAFPSAATEAEAYVESVSARVLRQGEPVLYLTEEGARTSEMVQAAAESLGARLERVDAAPEHGELELLGGWLPQWGAPADGARLRRARGRLSQFLVTREELERLKSGPRPRPVLLWLRNVDQWREEIRTALNGLLEDGYMDIEEADGRTVRLYRPPYLHLLAEMPADSSQEFSAAFFSRWVKIGVPQDAVEPEAPGGISDFEAVLRLRYELDPLEAHWTAGLRGALSSLDAERRWAGRGSQGYGAGTFFALAQAVAEARREDPRWTELLRRIAQEGYDPRQAGLQEALREHEGLVRDYRELAAETFAREARRIAGARLSNETENGERGDADRFARVLEAVLGSWMPSEDAEGAELSTEDGSPEGKLVAAGGVPVRAGAGADGLLAAARGAGVHVTPRIARALAVLARADALRRVSVLVGETGAVKTRVVQLWARLTGRRFYRYQTHAGSEISDLTMDLDQDASGEFRKRVKDFYALLRAGDVVIDIDEANLAPWILWSLEPLMRGERWVQPMFPEEKPFLIGDNVQVVMTYNPARYAGRQTVDPRLLENAVVAWMPLATREEAAQVVASFYGVWPELLLSPPVPDLLKEEELEKPVPFVAGQAPAAEVGGDRLMRRGEEVIDDSRSEPSEKPRRARGVFQPELFPYTRDAAYDVYDEAGERWTRGIALSVVDVPRLEPGQVEDWARELEKTHDLFRGEVRMTLGPRWQSLPAAGPQMQVLEIAAFDAAGRPLDAGLELARDSADNVFVRGRRAGEALLRYRVAVPAVSFGHPVPPGIPFRYPRRIPGEVRRAIALMGLKGNENDLRQVVYAVAAYIRSFSLKEDGIQKHGGSLYLDWILSKCGVCRHRAQAFARTLAGLGIGVRYVTSEAHAWAEVEVPNLGWVRVDLGGGGDPMNMDLSPLAREPHEPRYEDDLPKPESYAQDGRRMAEREREALERQGIERPADRKEEGKEAACPSGACSGGGNGSPAEGRSGSSPGDSENAEPGKSGGEAQSAGGGTGPQIPGNESGGEAQSAGGDSGAARESLVEDSRRLAGSLADLDQELARDAALHDELAPLFAGGKGDTQFVFDRMLRALKDASRIEKLKRRAGLEVDAQALIQRKPKPFIKRKRAEKMQTTAVSVLLDFSGSMESVKKQLAYTIAAVGENFWKLREAAPQHFFYDLSSFTSEPTTYVRMGQTLEREANDAALVSMANAAGKGSTDIVKALKAKFQDFMESKQGRGAKVKTLILVTDGADAGAIIERPDGSLEPAPALAELLGSCAAAGVDVVAIGIGPAAAQVKVLTGERQHYVSIAAERSEDIAEAIAKISELSSRGARLPDGELNSVMGIEPPR